MSNQSKQTFSLHSSIIRTTVIVVLIIIGVIVVVIVDVITVTHKTNLTFLHFYIIKCFMSSDLECNHPPSA